MYLCLEEGGEAAKQPHSVSGNLRIFRCRGRRQVFVKVETAPRGHRKTAVVLETAKLTSQPGLSPETDVRPPRGLCLATRPPLSLVTPASGWHISAEADGDGSMSARAGEVREPEGICPTSRQVTE